jgi:hypothetical protein
MNGMKVLSRRYYKQSIYIYIYEKKIMIVTCNWTRLNIISQYLKVKWSHPPTSLFCHWGEDALNNPTFHLDSVVPWEERRRPRSTHCSSSRAVTHLPHVPLLLTRFRRCDALPTVSLPLAQLRRRPAASIAALPPTIVAPETSCQWEWEELRGTNPRDRGILRRRWQRTVALHREEDKQCTRRACQWEWEGVGGRGFQYAGRWIR